MNVHVAPRTRLGRWAVGLMVVFVLWFILKGSAPFPMPTLAAAPFGVLAGVCAVVAIVSRGERSFLAFLTVFIGLWWVVFLLAEIIAPHE